MAKTKSHVNSFRKKSFRNGLWVAVSAVSVTGKPLSWKLDAINRAKNRACSCILCAVFVAWMLNVSRGVATTCVTGENAADATRCWIDISFFSTVRAPDLGYYSRVGPRNVKAADNYVGLRRWTRIRGTTIENEKNAVNSLSDEVLRRFDGQCGN